MAGTNFLRMSEFAFRASMTPPRNALVDTSNTASHPDSMTQCLPSHSCGILHCPLQSGDRYKISSTVFEGESVGFEVVGLGVVGNGVVGNGVVGDEVVGLEVVGLWVVGDSVSGEFVGKALGTGEAVGRGVHTAFLKVLTSLSARHNGIGSMPPKCPNVVRVDGPEYNSS